MKNEPPATATLHRNQSRSSRGHAGNQAQLVADQTRQQELPPDLSANPLTAPDTSNALSRGS